MVMFPLAGTITAADGKIGGFHISQSRINSENEGIILKQMVKYLLHLYYLLPVHL